jgi:CheY-like chemotaxis protein
VTPSAPPEVASLRTTVLFIDDNPADLDFWSHALTECSSAYSTLTATDIKSGLQLYQSQKVDCVILDLDLSGESGFEALFKLVPNRHRPSVAVVVLTKLPYPNLHNLVLHNGAFACLHKQQHSARDLENAIHQAIASIAATS